MRKCRLTPPFIQSARRLEEVIETFRSRVQLKNEREELGSERVVLVEGEARRGRGDDAVMMTGRTDGNKRVLFPRVEAAKGEYVKVTIDEVRGHTLRGVEVGLCDIEGEHGWFVWRQQGSKFVGEKGECTNHDSRVASLFGLEHLGEHSAKLKLRRG